jgi:putative transposase
MKFGFMLANRSTFKVKKMAEVFEVSESGYHAWAKRFLEKYRSPREKRRDELKEQILEIFIESNGSYGSRKVTQELRRVHKKRVNHKCVEDIMRSAGIISKVTVKHKAQTTNSNHKLPVAPNLLQRQFQAVVPHRKWVSDITYVYSKEGWLYKAAIMDLCGRIIVGTATSDHIDTELVVNALTDAINRVGKANVRGCILHSDRGSQYCSRIYQNLLKAYGFECSMSRKGNCWDNAPMESFWGKMKAEWLNDQCFETREEARRAVFEYTWIYYNRKRIHATNGYMTPEEYYNAQLQTYYYDYNDDSDLELKTA